MKISYLLSTALCAVSAAIATPADACTGITLTAKDGSRVLARTIEWGGSILKSEYVIVPRGYVQQSFTPTGTDGLKFTAKYGYVGLSTELKEFVVEGLNEAGLSAGLFYFPGYGEYEKYDQSKKASTLADLQLVSWILASFGSVEEVAAALPTVHITGIHPDASTAHWRVGDTSGRQIVIEITDGVPHIYENTLGVLTNSPGFEWHLTNLNNYVNLYPGGAAPKNMNGVNVAAFGAGSGFLGIPGDVTPPSRFIRAAFYQTTAPQYATGRETVLQSFHILNNFDIPIGIEHAADEIPEGLPSATQWTTATDITARTIYYRTAWNGTLRGIDLKSIDFTKTKYQAHPLDERAEEPIQMLKIR